MFNPLTREPHAIGAYACRKRVRAMIGGDAVVDSERAILLYEGGLPPVYYFPDDDVNSAFLVPSDTRTHCPFKGTARYWSISAGGKIIEDAVWSYPAPDQPEALAISGYKSFYWSKIETWMEEDEEVFVHPRDPFTRIDILPSKRTTQIIVDGETVVTSNSTLMLFETGLPPRLYFPKTDLRMDMLVPSQKRTQCPYKGEAEYYSMVLESGDILEDLVWQYPDPIAETARIKNRYAFHTERCEAVYIDGELYQP